MSESETIVKVSAYEICTPKYLEGREYAVGRYDHEQIEVLLYRMMNHLTMEQRAFRHDNKMINLASYKDSDDAEFIEGIFTSARYGQEQDIIDVFDQTVTGQKGSKEGVKNEIPFVLDKNTGLLLIQNDDERVVSKFMLQKFFKFHGELVKDYIESFNKVNKGIHLPRNAYLSVTTIPAKEFFEEISELSTIKEVYLLADIKENTNNKAIDYLTSQAEQNELAGYQKLRISLVNNVKQSGIRQVESYFRKLMELEAYQDYGVVGFSETGKRRQIDWLSHSAIQSYEIATTKNEKGLINKPKLIEEMVQIAKHNNPISRKRGTFDMAKKVYNGGDKSEYGLEVAAAKGEAG